MQGTGLLQLSKNYTFVVTYHLTAQPRRNLVKVVGCYVLLNSQPTQESMNCPTCNNIKEKSNPLWVSSPEGKKSMSEHHLKHCVKKRKKHENKKEN